MNIFEFAMQKEEISRNYYIELAQKTGSVGLKNICEMLAEEEAEHYRIVEQLSQDVSPELYETAIIKDAQKIFEQMKLAADDFNIDVSELELYQKARSIEKDSKEFYLEKAIEVEDQFQKDTFNKLAHEEHKHFVLVDNICDFISSPQYYLENGEFNHIEDYVEGVF